MSKVKGTAPSRHRFAALGLVYLVVFAILVTSSVLAYRRELPWQRAVEVTLVTRQPGLELNPNSDVKIQGRLVGRVQRVTSDGVEATIHLALEPDETRWVPANADAAIVPKTLFGEKYVDLLAPLSPDDEPISDGAVIRQSTTATEIGDVYARLVPLLRSIDPAQLSTVLNTLALTLDGRGETLGRSIEQTNAFLGQLNPSLDALNTDIDRLATTLQIYDGAAPDLLTTLRQSSGISRELLVPSEEKLASLLDTLTTTSQTADAVLRRNARDLILLTSRAEPVLSVLDTYSSVIPCSLRGLHLLDKLGNQVTGGRAPFTLLNVDVLIQGDPYVYPRDLPTGPRSDANNANLPSLVPSWAPHCPRFGRLQSRVKDAKPFSLSPLPFQAVGDEAANRSSYSGGAANKQRLDLAGLLLSPMLDDAGESP